MIPILKIDFQKRKQLHFSKENYLNYTHTHPHTHTHTKDTMLHVTILFSLRQGKTRTSSGPITLPLTLSSLPPFLCPGWSNFT